MIYNAKGKKKKTEGEGEGGNILLKNLFRGQHLTDTIYF